MVLPMSDEYRDPSGSTDQFRAFATADTAAPAARSRLPLVLGLAAAALVVVVVAVILAVA
jgi:hypothetical protein